MLIALDIVVEELDSNPNFVPQLTYEPLSMYLVCADKLISSKWNLVKDKKGISRTSIVISTMEIMSGSVIADFDVLL